MKKQEKETYKIPDMCVNQNLNTSFANTTANTLGSPSRPRRIVSSDGKTEMLNTDIIERVVLDAKYVIENDGVFLVDAYIFSNLWVLKELEKANVVVVVQKDYLHRRTQLAYLKLGCRYTRDQFPGVIMPNLLRRDGQDDHGIIDGVRFFGNAYPTPRARKNELRPMDHEKLIVGLIPNKNGILKPVFGYAGTANITHGADANFETMQRTIDSKLVEGYYNTIVHTFSLSEGLCNFSHGVEPTYTYVTKKVKLSAVPPCPKCSSTNRVSLWTPPDPAKKLYVPHRVLRCTDCGDQSKLFLKEGVPVK
jgi:hypothetical protein